MGQGAAQGPAGATLTSKLPAERRPHHTDGLHVRAALRPDADGEETARLVRRHLADKLAAQGLARPAVQVELHNNLQDERDTAGKLKLVESRLSRPAARVP